MRQIPQSNEVKKTVRKKVVSYPVEAPNSTSRSV